MHDAITVFPQPAAEQLHIMLPSQRGSLRIADAIGRVVCEQAVGQFDAPSVKLDAAGLANGVYTVAFITEATTHTTSFVIQH
jgi:hypothetical protein